MSRKYNFEYIVIGSGPAGSAVALNLAKAKKRVAIVEKRFFGGSDLNTRDIPYSVALDFAHSYAKMRLSPELKNQNIHFNLPNLIAHQLETVIRLGGNNKKDFEDAKITCLEGSANFLNPHTIAIDEKEYTAENFIIASGSILKETGITGTDTVKCLTPENAIRVRQLPKAVLVVGGGSTGCEIAEYFAELGTKVLLLEMAERILPKEDQEVGEAIAKYFTYDLGITVLPNSKVVAIEEDDLSKRVIFRNGYSEKLVRVDSIVLATGSQPAIDYGLENANVKYKRTGIIVDKLFQTSTKNIYAIGDCIGNDSSTSRANYEGTLLASNLINRTKNPVNYSGITRVTKTFPEIAVVGLNEDDLIKRDRKYKKAIVNIDEIVAGKIDNLSQGFIKLISDKNNHILGASIVAPNAELMSSEIALVVRHNLSALEIASTPHSINSYNQLFKLAAKKLIEKKK